MVDAAKDRSWEESTSLRSIGRPEMSVFVVPGCTNTLGIKKKRLRERERESERKRWI